MPKVPLPISMLAVTFAIIYVSMCPAFNPWLIDGMMFHPYTDMDTSKLTKIGGVPGREITFERGLTGWFYKTPNSKYVVLFSHGNAGNLAHRWWKIAPLIECGQSVFIWDYAGFGHSAGLATRSSIGTDALAAYDVLTNMGYTPDQITLYGESLGTGVNAEILQHRKCRAVIIDSGFTSLEEIAKEKCPIFCLYPKFLLPPQSMMVRNAIDHLPCLIIHGAQDEVIPYHHAEDLHRCDPNSTLITLPHSSHNSIASEDAISIRLALKEFFAQLSQY